ncbi:MAG: UvrD-helicase domain-containing protein [Bryobacterales bacterium]|nr:UvrD-helicase domain-containing protein [Bryobacterales bacterium]
MNLLEGLNPQQREAVVHGEGPLLILAGAGSGKTKVITHRIGYLIQQRRVYGPSILAVTFTNKAAGEMRERIFRILEGSDGAGPNVSTFHSFCVRLLRRDGAPLASLRHGFTTRFNIYDDDDQLVVVKQAYRKLGLDDKFMPYRSALSYISQAKNKKEGPQDIYARSTDPKTTRLAVIFENYEAALAQANALDFDDLLLQATRLLSADEATRDAWNRRLDYLMIDEYQDTNRPQYELMRLLSRRHSNVCVVGDEDQSIYGWRGADIRNILDFEKDYPGATVIRLEQNYRSTKNILAAASAVVANNKERKGKWLWTDSHEGSPVGVYEAMDGENEALYIADTIDRILRRDPSTHVAVLYRTNFQSRQIEEALRRYGRKYLVVGGFSFYQRAEVKDALAYVKLLLAPHDNVSLLRIINTPARGIGKTTIDQLEKLAADRGTSLWDAIRAAVDEDLLGARAGAALQAFRRMVDEVRQESESAPPDTALRLVLDRSGYRKMLSEDPTPEAESRMGNLEELLTAAAEAGERGEDMTAFLDHAALVSDADQVDEQAQTLLLTMHNAKGLEFPVVFIAGLEEGLFPHSRSLSSEAQMEEERRLCYVAMTRAKKQLFLTSAKYRRKYGGGPPEPCIPSRFLREVPAKLTEDLSPVRRTREQVDLFSEQHEVRQSAQRNTYTGKTYNSLEHISQFFAERGKAVPVEAPRKEAPGPVANPPAARPVPPGSQRKKGGLRPGATVIHEKYGRGTVLRIEGDGEEAKLTVSFPGVGLKKLFAKYAGLKIEE